MALRPKRDHYAAITYLSRWCDPVRNQPMRAYRKSNLEPFPCWPADVCKELGGDLTPDYLSNPNALGDFRAIFEPHWARAVDAAQRRQMSAADKFIVAGYWANLSFMTPVWRGIGMQLFEQEARAVLPLLAQDYPKTARINLKSTPTSSKRSPPKTCSLPHGSFTISPGQSF